MKLTSGLVKAELRKIASPERAKASVWFFKTGKGEYGEGDRFLGANNPGMRSVAKKCREMPFSEIGKLLGSGWHEERQTGLFILTYKYEKASEKLKKKIVDFYMSHLNAVNNWDLVDLSASRILGDYLLQRDRKVLYRLAKSRNLWERRIAIIATLAFIRENQFEDALRISEMLLHDGHDLIHKAAGWVLREVGKKNVGAEEKFLKKHCREMPRTMLRYAIEKFGERKRKFYMVKRCSHKMAAKATFRAKPV